MRRQINETAMECAVESEHVTRRSKGEEAMDTRAYQIATKQVQRVKEARERLISQRDDLEKRLRSSRSQLEDALAVRRLILRLDDFALWIDVSAEDCKAPASTTPAAADKEAVDMKATRDAMRAHGATVMHNVRTDAMPYTAEHNDLADRLTVTQSKWKDLSAKIDCLETAMDEHRTRLTLEHDRNVLMQDVQRTLKALSCAGLGSTASESAALGRAHDTQVEEIKQLMERQTALSHRVEQCTFVDMSDGMQQLQGLCAEMDRVMTLRGEHLRQTHGARDAAEVFMEMQERCAALLRAIVPPNESYGSNPREVAMLMNMYDNNTKAVDSLARSIEAHEAQTSDVEAPDQVRAELIATKEALRTQLETLKTTASTVGDRLQRAKAVEGFVYESKQALKWMAGIQDKIRGHGTERAGIAVAAPAKALVQRHDALLEMIRVRFKDLEGLCATGTSLRTRYPDDAEKVAEAITSLTSTMHSVRELGDATRVACVQTYQQLTFRDDVLQAGTWLEDQRKHLSNAHPGESIQANTTARAQHETFEKGIQARKAVFAQLERTLEGYKAEGFPDAAMLESSLSDLLTGVTSLESDAGVHIAFLVARAASLGYAQRLEELRAWVRDKMALALKDRDLSVRVTSTGVMASHDALMLDIESHTESVHAMRTSFEGLQGDDVYKADVLLGGLEALEMEWAGLESEANAKKTFLMQQKQYEDVREEGDAIARIFAGFEQEASSADVGDTYQKWVSVNDAFADLRERVSVADRSRAQVLLEKSGEILGGSDSDKAADAPKHPRFDDIQAVATEVRAGTEKLHKSLERRGETLESAGVSWKFITDAVEVTTALTEKTHTATAAHVGTTLAEVELQLRLHEAMEHDAAVLGKRVDELSERAAAQPPSPMLARAQEVHGSLMTAFEDYKKALQARKTVLDFENEELSFMNQVDQTKTWIDGMRASMGGDPDLSSITSVDACADLCQRHEARGKEIDAWQEKISAMLDSGRSLSANEHTRVDTVLKDLDAQTKSLSDEWRRRHGNYTEHLSFVNVNSTADDLDDWLTHHANNVDAHLTVSADMGVDDIRALLDSFNDMQASLAAQDKVRADMDSRVSAFGQDDGTTPSTMTPTVPAVPADTSVPLAEAPDASESRPNGETAGSKTNSGSAAAMSQISALLSTSTAKDTA